MAISISAVLLLLVLAVIFMRNGGLKVSHGLVCLLLGFLLASTPTSPPPSTVASRRRQTSSAVFDREATAGSPMTWAPTW